MSPEIDAEMAEIEAGQKLEEAIALIQDNRLFDALPLLDAVIAAKPEMAVAYVQRARIRRRLGDLQRAITDYAKAIALEPTAETYLARALVWLQLEQVKGAIADSHQAARLSPEMAGAHRVLGKALGILGDGKRAITAYKQAARCYIQAKDKESAQRCLDAIEPLQALPPYTEPEGQQTITASAGSADVEAYLDRVRVKSLDGQYESAIADVNWLLNAQPDRVEALCLRGVLYARQGKRAEAVQDLARALELAPDDPDVRFSRGQMRLILNDGHGAVEEFTQLITAEGTQPLAKYFVERGHSYRLMGELENAFKDYSNAIASDSEAANLYELRGEVQAQMGSQQSAIEDYRKAATLWLDRGNWQKHQEVVEALRQLTQQSTVKGTSQAGKTVPILRFDSNYPVVSVLFDGKQRCEVVIDRNTKHSIITKRMATQLNLDIVSFRYVYLLDGTPIELPIARLRSVMVGDVIVSDVYVAVAPDKATPVLGQDCFSLYSIRISGNEMTFARR